MTNYSHGHYAEKVAARYLQSQGYKVYELNWRTPRAEIDIVCQTPEDLLMFMEVKYRQTAHQGTGLEYITSAKQRQMRFAAELWVAKHNYNGEYALGAVEVSGPEYAVTNVIDTIY
jgi:uncharacterized protein (TIGR00252 family)